MDERALRDIVEMGFNREAARQALTDNKNNLEMALNSLLTGPSGSRPSAVVAESNKPQTRGIRAKTNTYRELPFSFQKSTIALCAHETGVRCCVRPHKCIETYLAPS